LAGFGAEVVAQVDIEQVLEQAEEIHRPNHKFQ
jgi:hypothetical protein